MSRKFLIFVSIGIVCVSIIVSMGIFFIRKKSVDLELTLLDKTYRYGQTITLNAVVTSSSFRPLQTLINARVVGDKTDEVLKTYFPTLQRHGEYKFEFKCPVTTRLPSGKYRLIVRVMTYGKGDAVEDILTAERYFRVASRRKLTAREIAARKLKRAGKGIPLDADLILYPVEAEDVGYGRTVQLAGMFHNITYWSGAYKLALTVIAPDESKKEYTDNFTVKSGEQKEFLFSFTISPDMPEGRYAVICRLFDDRKGKKEFGKLINEVVSSFSVVDRKPVVNLDQVALQVPGNGEYDFKIEATDDRGVNKVTFHYNLVRKGMLKTVVRLKKRKETGFRDMELLSGDKLDGVWGCVVSMPSEGSKFVFSIEARDSKGQIVFTDRYPVSVIKPIKKKKKEEQMEMQGFPGFQGYNEWEY